MDTFHRSYVFLDDKPEIMGVPLDQALSFLFPMMGGSAIGHMGYGMMVGAVIFLIYRKISNSAGFNLMGKLMKYGIKPKGCLPTPAAITYYHGH